ncbi:hypothetical protein MKW94_019103 [Papaver nudicaule]|uniref:FAD-binding domain-containing protein n=1 Tax=Papaver nudicaule TaxID=74823 RepID=A0AA42AWY4_PAPNU|nr:hypothetical protein [Papaver nudicaule]
MANVVMREKVVIVGGGVAGLTTALLLRRANELRVTGGSGSLTLFSNAWIALEALGVAHKLTSVYKPFKRGQVTNVSTGVTQEVLLTTDEGYLQLVPRSVNRRALLEALLEELPADTIRYSSRLRSIEKTETRNDADSFGVIIHLEDGTTIHTKGVMVVRSVVAKWLRHKAPVYSGRYAVRGLGVFPEGHGLKHEVQQFVAEEVIQHAYMPSSSWGPPQFTKPWDLLFGNDAMHPMTPDLGQGGCSALEDAVVLGRHMGNSYIRNGGTLSQEDLEVEIGMYVKERRFRTAGLITGSYISGWIQQGDSGAGIISSLRVVGWLTKFLRDSVFYRFSFCGLVGLTSSGN